MAGQKRTDNKGRILKDNETQRKDGTYRFTYTDADGKRHDVYSRRLVPTDRLPPGCKDDLSLREKERKILRDLEDGIKATVENRATLNDLFNLYISNKPELKQSTRANYLYMHKKYVQDDIGKKKISSIKYSDVKAYYNRLIRERGFKPNSMEIIHTIIHPVFTMAVRDGYIRINPATGAMAEIKKSNNWEKPKRHALTKAEQVAFIDYIKSSKIYNHWSLLFFWELVAALVKSLACAGRTATLRTGLSASTTTWYIGNMRVNPKPVSILKRQRQRPAPVSSPCWKKSKRRCAQNGQSKKS